MTPCKDPPRDSRCGPKARYLEGSLTGESGEFGIIERLRKRFPAIGDDAAVVTAPAGPLLLAADTLAAGVHADLSAVSLEDFGWRAVTVNVSDVAAMGGRPLHLLVTIAGPASTDVDRLMDGVAEAAAAYSCEVVGGDLANADTLVVTVAVTGTIDDGGAAVLRSGAHPGDGIYVTGPLGGAAAGGWRARPVARVGEGEAARRAGATAMIDVSDGLIADLNHVAAASGVGYELDLERLPLAPGATLEQALHGGDDYELVFTAPVDPRLGIRFGVCTDDVSQRLASRGWEHRFQ